MSEDQALEPFDIQFVGVEKKSPRPGYTDAFLVTFRVKRGFQDFTIPIWVGTQTCRPADVVRVAMHRLHLNLLELVEGTRSLRLSPDQYQALVHEGASPDDANPPDE